MNKAWAIGFVAVVALGGCIKPEGSCTELDKGDKVRVQILEKLGADSQYAAIGATVPMVPPCAIDDVSKASYEFELSQYAGELSSCFMPKCADSFPTSSEETNGTGYNGANWLCVNTDRKIAASACEASRFVGLLWADPSADPFSAPQAGKAPTVVLIRTLSFGGALEGLTCTDPQHVFPSDAKQSDTTSGDYYECADAWAVQLMKQ